MQLQRFRANIYILGNEHEMELPFKDAIQLVADQPTTESKVFAVNGMARRLEHHEVRQGIHLCNFNTFRYSGPGRAQSGHATRRFNLGPNESFSHESAMLYDPRSKLVFIESARIGMGSGAIGRYFGFFAHSDKGQYKLTPVLDQQARTRALANRVFRSINMRVATGQGGRMDDDLDNVTAVGHGIGGEFMELEIKVAPRASRWRSLDPRRVPDFLGQLLRRAEEGSVDKLRLKGMSNEDDPIEEIDLLQHRESRERELDVNPRSLSE